MRLANGGDISEEGRAKTKEETPERQRLMETRETTHQGGEVLSHPTFALALDFKPQGKCWGNDPGYEKCLKPCLTKLH